MKTQFYSIAEVSRLLGVAEHRVNYAHRARKVPSPAIFAGRRLYTKADIDRLAQHFDLAHAEPEGGHHE
jgi:DNA-binding transcriptional MerR regulator